MPFLIPLLLLAGVAGIVFYEKSRGSSSPDAGSGPVGGPGPGPGSLPGTSMSPGVTHPANPFAIPSMHLQPLHMQPLQPPSNPILQAAQSLLASTQAAPGTMGTLYHEIIVAQLRTLAQSPTQQTLAQTIAQLSQGDLGPEGQDVVAALEPLTTRAQTGQWGGVWGEDRMAGTDAGDDVEVCVPASQVAALCTVILAQALQQGGGGGGGAPAPMPGPAALAPGLVAPSPAHAGALRPGSKMKKGQNYFVSYPAGAALSSILWEAGTVADAMASPTKFVADPTQNVQIPQASAPRSAPPAWMAHFGPGRAIAVMTWIGPDGHAGDPGVRVWGMYNAGR